MARHAPHPSQPRLICVGYGNMARALLAGIIESKPFDKYEICIAGRDLHKAQNLCDDLARTKSTDDSPTAPTDTPSTDKSPTNDNPPSTPADDNPTRPRLKALCIDSHTPLNIQDCEVLLCVKPHALRAFSYVGEAHIAYSVMAGVRIETIAQVLNARSFARIMPNVGALYGKSASCVYVHSTRSSRTDIESAVRRLVESFGNCVMVDSESLIDASIATSGSAPAFLAVVAQSLIDSGIYHGLSYAQSRDLVAQTFSGFAALLEHKSPDEIKIAITSPAGTTARGLAVLEKSSVRGAFIEAGIESIKRAKELAGS